MFKIVKVSGNSLYPEYREGDFLVIGRIPFPFRSINSGAMIVFQEDLHGQMVKRIDKCDRTRKRYFVLGSHPDSLDSRQLGWIDSKRIVGKVIAHIKK